MLINQFSCSWYAHNDHKQKNFGKMGEYKGITGKSDTVKVQGNLNAL